MTTLEQLVDAYGRARVARAFLSEMLWNYEDKLKELDGRLDAARAALLAAMRGDAVPVAWRMRVTRAGVSQILYTERLPFEFRGESWQGPIVHEKIEPLYDRPPAPSAIAEGMKWRPMETAPMDGTRVILGWNDMASLPMHTELGRFRSGTGKGSGWCNTYGHSFAGTPTHWLALPPALGEG